MELIGATSYIFNGGVCLTLAILLLGIKTGQAEGYRPYLLAKRLFAASALCDVLVDIIIGVCIILDADYLILGNMAYPLICYTQFCMISYAILYLVHSTILEHKGVFYILLAPIIAAFLVYLGSYFLSEGELFSDDHYIEFSKTHFARLICLIFNIIILSQYILFTYRLIIETERFNEKLANYYSGREVSNGKRLNYIVYTLALFFFLEALDYLLADNLAADSIFTLLITAICILSTLLLFNFQGTYYHISKLDNYYRGPATRDEMKKIAQFFYPTYSVTPQSEIAQKEMSAESDMSDRIAQWASRNDRPYAKEGITLGEVAQEMEVNPRLLSGFLNSIYRLNFNTWIGKLRIEEAARMMADNPDLTISQIAYATGFSDPAGMTKTFKKVKGETPTDYKKRLKAPK